jgi:3-hydroxy acid dehydrogenase / malonic semialdehyde reductase
MNKIVLITGATSGIGEACAQLLAANHFNLILTGRRADRLQLLKEKLITEYEIDVCNLTFDIRNESEVQQALESLPNTWRNIDILVNNAGLSAGLDPIFKGETDDWNRMIDTNVKGLLYVTRLVSEGMVARRSGHIVNVSSIAGKEVYPNGNVYCATKHTVAALTRAMRLDLHTYGIRVGSISPGMVETEFSLVRFHGDKEKAENIYKGFTPLSASDIAEALLFIVSRPPHVNIDDVFITASVQGSSRDTYRS